MKRREFLRLMGFGAAAIVTRNTRDLLANQLKFPDLRIVTPEALLREETP